MQTSPLPTDRLIVRRPRGPAVALATFELILLAYVGVAVWQKLYSMVVFGVICAVFLAVAAVAWARARTELDADGIRCRTLRGERLIPWSEVRKVVPTGAGRGGIVVACRDGRQVSLPGTRGEWGPNGPHPADVVGVIQTRIGEHAPAGPRPDRPVPETIERRLSWRGARQALTALGIGGLLCIGLAAATPWLVPAIVALLALAGFLVLVTVRSRTVIGPDGIRNRAVRRQVFVPWSEITAIAGMESPPRVVQIIRSDGTKTILAAVRDGDVAPDGLDFDDIVEVIRARAGLNTTPAPEDDRLSADPPAVPEAGPVILRPSRRPLLWLLPVAVAFVLAVYWTFDSTLLVFLSGYLVLVPVMLLAVALKLLRGRTEAGPHGLRNRLIIRTRSSAWRDVDAFVVNPTMFGRVLQVRRSRGKRFTLAAPREGLLGRNPDFDEQARALQAVAAAHRPSVPPISDPVSPRVLRTTYGIGLTVLLAIGLSAWRPWLEPWWPGRHEATSLPRACAVANAASLRLLADSETIDDQRADYRYSTVSRCDRSGDADMRLELDMERKTLGSSATSGAREKFAVKRDGIAGTGARPITGLGDEAWEKHTTTDERTRVRLVVRRANVVIDLDYGARRPSAQVLADATTLARTAVAAIRVR